MISDGAAIILAGGKSRRFGSNKAFADWNNKKMIHHVIEAVAPLFSKVFIPVKEVRLFAPLNSPRCEVIKDHYQESHPLGGIYSGLLRSPAETVFVCACDMPFINPSLIAFLWNKKENWEAVVPEWQGKRQPLFALYSKRSLPVIEKRISQKKFKLQDLLDELKTLIVKEKDWIKADPTGSSFVDIDTQSQLKDALTHAH